MFLKLVFWSYENIESFSQSPFIDHDSIDIWIVHYCTCHTSYSSNELKCWTIDENKSEQYRDFYRLGVVFCHTMYGPLEAPVQFVMRFP